MKKQLVTTNSQYNYLALFFSIVLHFVIVVIISQSAIFDTDKELMPDQPPIIQASLIFDITTPKPTLVDSKIRKDMPEVIQSKTSKPLEETYEKPENLEHKTATAEIVPIQLPPAIESPSASSSSKVITKPKFITPTAEIARRHLSQFHQQQQNKMAAQASKNYQQLKNSPIIDAEIKDTFLTEDEKILKKRQVRANCNNATNKTAAVLLGFLGAQIRCTQPPSVTHFIQDRINKKKQLPKTSTDRNQARPQSVVIIEDP